MIANNDHPVDKRREFSHIRLGAFAPLVAAMAAVEPVDLDLLAPEPGSLAARLDALEPVELPREDEEAAS